MTKDILHSLLITHQGNSQVKDNKIELLVQQYEQFTILEEESIDSGFARFNTIITSLKALESFSSKNYVRRFLRALHPKWRSKVTTIEESKVHKVFMENDFEIYKGKRKGQLREERWSFRQRDEKKGKSDRKCFRCGDSNNLLGDCPKLPRNKKSKGLRWSDNASSLDDDSMQIEYDNLLKTSMEDVEGCLWCRGLYGAKGKDVAIFRTNKLIVVLVKWVRVLDMQVTLHDKRIVMKVTLHYEATMMQVMLHDKRIVMQVTLHYEPIVMQVTSHDKRIVLQVTLYYEAIVMQVTLHDKRIVMQVTLHYEAILIRNNFNQSKYIKKIGLEDSKPTKRPMSTEIKLTKDDEFDFVDSTKYQGYCLTSCFAKKQVALAILDGMSTSTMDETSSHRLRHMPRRRSDYV
uniref:UBN2 domain-containing protein n=1 Tax=Tanacetum cinerariifolium TaxID=118510 RepID=A0A6L2JGS1_TANCI|nr:UBN2 domain-containing protein [Tanacetum cinerariifolium]